MFYQCGSFLLIQNPSILELDGNLKVCVCLEDGKTEFGQRDFTQGSLVSLGYPELTPRSYIAPSPTTSRVDAFFWAREKDVIGSHEAAEKLKGFLIKVGLLGKCKTEMTSFV